MVTTFLAQLRNAERQEESAPTARKYKGK